MDCKKSAPVRSDAGNCSVVIGLHGLCRRRSHFADQGKIPLSSTTHWSWHTGLPVRNRHCTRSARACGHEPRRGIRLVERSQYALPHSEADVTLPLEGPALARRPRRPSKTPGSARRVRVPSKLRNDPTIVRAYCFENRDWHAISLMRCHSQS